MSIFSHPSSVGEELKNWYAVYTKPHSEQIAAESLQSVDIEIFYPRCRELKRTNKTSFTRLKPLFSRYIFARFSSRIHHRLIKYSRGVNDIVCYGTTPVPIEDEIISSIRERMDNEGLVVLEPRRFRSGDAVTVSSGPLQGLDGIFDQELSDGERVVIFLDAVCPARVIVSAACLSATEM